MTLFEEPAGRSLLTIAVVANTIGYFWMRRMIQIKV
jgi:Flp pilus assembly protein TadB